MGRWTTALALLPGIVLVMMPVIGGCGDGGAPAGGADTAAANALPGRPVLDDHQFMAWVLEPASDVIWDSAGAIITLAGEESLAPVDQAGWDRVRNAAAVVAESGNLLLLPGRSKGADWDEFSRAMTRMGERAMAAAQAQDADAVFEVGGQLYNVCVACHQVYFRPEQEAAGQ